MSRRSPTSFVFSVAAEVIAVVFIVSVLPRVDLRRSAGAAAGGAPAVEFLSNPAPLPLPTWGQTAEAPPRKPAHETSYYERRTQPEAAREPSREREITPLISVAPAQPGHAVEPATPD